LLNFFPVPQTTVQDCGKQNLLDVVLGVRVGFVSFIKTGCINPLAAAAKLKGDKPYVWGI